MVPETVACVAQAARETPVSHCRLARSESELALFARIRSALDPSGTLNPHILPH